MLDIEQLARDSLEICKQLLVEQGSLRPFVVVFDKDRNRHMLDLAEFMQVDEFWERASKLLARATIMQRLRETEALGYILHIEAWSANFSPEEAENLKDLPRPRDVRERRELLFAEYEAVTDTGGVVSGALGVYFHKEGDTIVFGEEIQEGAPLKGTFANMLSAVLNPDAQQDDNLA